MIQLEGVTKLYRIGDEVVHALDGVDLTIDRGEFVAIMGQSGSGKSTLMNIIGCLDRPTAGRYLFEGQDVGRMSDDARSTLRGHAFGFVFQSYNLVPRLSVVEQVGLPLLYQRVPAAERRRRATEALRRVGLADRTAHLPTQLSGGQQQRVAIARSLVVQPRIMLADEPTGALDTQTGADVMAIFTDLVQQQGITVIIVTHEPEVAAYAHRRVRVRDGHIVEDVQQARATGTTAATPAAAGAAS